jgi:hypothetical protein
VHYSHSSGRSLIPPTYTTALNTLSFLSHEDPTDSGKMPKTDDSNVSRDQTHPANQQVDPVASSSSSTSDQERQSFEATTAALETNELLHLIIAEVPLKYRTSIRGVSEAWKAATRRVGYTLNIIGYRYQWGDSKSMGSGNHASDGCHPVLPAIASDATFDINPLFSYPSYTTPVLDRYGTHYQKCIGFIYELAGHEHEFIINPPLTQALISLDYRGLRGAILRIPGGIRVGDLKEYDTKLRLHERCNTFSFFQFVRDGDGPPLSDQVWQSDRYAVWERNHRFDEATGKWSHRESSDTKDGELT